MSEATEVKEIVIFQEVKAGAAGLLEEARARAVITTDEQFVEAAEYRKVINTWKRQALSKLEPVVSAARVAWQAALKLQNEAIAPLDDALGILDRPIADYNDLMERRRREEEERRISEARKKAEDDKLAMAEEADKSGDHERAEAILEQPDAPPPPPSIPKARVEGVSFRENWKADAMVNMKLLVEAVAKGQIADDVLLPNMPVLNKLAKAYKGNMRIPGVRAICEKVVASRA